MSVVTCGARSGRYSDGTVRPTVDTRENGPPFYVGSVPRLDVIRRDVDSEKACGRRNHIRG